jgi:tetratricopeptide (TPR) repeat protein
MHQEIARLFGEAGLECWRQLEGHIEAGAAILVLHVSPANVAVCEQALVEFIASRQRTCNSVQFQSEAEMLRASDALATLEMDGIGAVWLNFIGPRPTDDAWKKATGKALESLEQSRQKILEHIKVPILFVGEHWFQDVFHEAARDLLSMRSISLGLYTSNEDPGTLTPTEQRSFTGVETASNPDHTLAQAKRLAGRKDLVPQRAELLVRTAGGYRRAGRLDLAESSLRMALAALQEAPPTVAFIAAERARVLAVLANVLVEMGRRGDAVAKAQEAEQICRRLVKMQPGVYEQALSGALDVLALSLGKIGRFEEALAKAREAAGIAEQLAKAKPGAFERAWAESLYTLVSWLLKNGRNEEALAKSQEMERILDGLAKDHPETFESGWAHSLAGLAEVLITAGQLEAAASKYREALKIFERLAKVRPADFEAEVALCLHMLARILGQIGETKPQGIKALVGIYGRAGRMTEALDNAQRAAEIFERLAKTRPNDFEGKLADVRCNLGERLYQLGRMDDAWKNIDAAICLYDRLAKTRPDAIEPLWARAMSMKRCCLRATNSPHAAAASTAAVRLLSRHFLQKPQLHASMMAYMVQYYIEDMKAAGQEPDRKLLGPILQILNKVKKN